MTADPFRGYGFTIRQRQVVRRIGRGLSYAQIGRELKISPRTVEKHADDVCRMIDYQHLTRYAAIRQFCHEVQGNGTTA